jgi:hypothetical protein
VMPLTLLARRTPTRDYIPMLETDAQAAGRQVSVASVSGRIGSFLS